MDVPCEIQGAKNRKQWQDWRAICRALFLKEALGWKIGDNNGSVRTRKTLQGD